MESQNLKDILEEFESKFNVNYPDTNNATYTSELNYSMENDTPFKRWYRYKEGFSYLLIKKLIKEHSLNHSGIILDPFLGSGTTSLASNNLKRDSVGFETNPFSAFVSKCKLSVYTLDNINHLKEAYSIILNTELTNEEEYQMPCLSFADKVFDEPIKHEFMALKNVINRIKCCEKEYNLLKLCWLSILEEISNYRKAGNGLKKRKKKNTSKVKELFLSKLSTIIDDIEKYKISTDIKIIEDSSLNLLNYYPNNYFDGIIYSPPYANCFDYIEIYKLELWFGEFVKDYTDIQNLRKKAMRSNLSNVDCSQCDNEYFKRLLKMIPDGSLWDNKISKMLNDYFIDFETLLKQSYYALEQNGFCCIIVGNSAYGGVVFPTDLIVADIASKIGFKVEKIDVDRFLITSSQQYEKTLAVRKFLRESIVCLRKL